jgi:uncharacterized protein (DUF2062 family)
VTRDVLEAKLASAWRRLRGGELTPLRAALSVAAGLAIGVTPAYGAHILLVLAVCVPLGLDVPVSYLAANVSIPPLAPFLWLIEVQLGALASTGHTLPLEVAALRSTGPWRFAKEVLLGTLLLAPSAALGGGVATFAALSAVRTAGRRSPFQIAADSVSARYAKGRASSYHYARVKLLADPVARRLWALGGELGRESGLGGVADVGAGRGQLGILLLESGRATQVTGLDWDAAKIEDARRASYGLDASYREADLRSSPIPPCDTALIVDVLHYLTDAEQDGLLARAASAARERVVVREMDPDRGWRSRLTRWQESITTAVRFNRGARVHARPISCIERALHAAGFRVAVEPCWGRTPFANVLVVGTRVNSSSRADGS